MDAWTALAQPLMLPARVARFLADGQSLASIPGQMEAALATREDRFLRIVGRRVFGSGANPYRRLFDHSGCTAADLRDLTRRHGLDDALRRLAESGVYLTAAELKGREDVVRGALRFRVNPRELEMASRGIESRSSGSSNPPQRGTTSFDWLARQTTATGAFVLAHGLESHHHGVFDPMLPGHGGVMFMLMLARLRLPCERWFARSVPFRNAIEHLYFRVLAREVSAVGSVVGPGFAKPEPVSDDHLTTIIGWIEESRRAGRRTTVRTAASNAARIATKAAEIGASLEGLTFLASGEPMTAAKRAAIEAVGARATVMYGFEPGTVYVGLGCANPVHGDEMHVGLTTLAAVNPRTMPWGDRTIRPLLFTTLYESAGRLLINAESGDYAGLDNRNCGCRLHELGLTLHVHGVRSYEKLTAEGMNYPVDDLIELLESRLPAEFGGGPCDYQLIEEEGANGQTRLTLRVHPRLGVLDEGLILSRLAVGVGRANRNQRFIAAAWRMSETFRVMREPPRTSPRGKTSPVQLAVGAPTRAAGS